MRVALLLLLVLLLVPSSVVADGAWQKRRVVVRDYLPAERKADLAAMVDAFNAVMPKRGPRLVYVAMPQQPCSTARAKGAIAVCEDAATAGGETTLSLRAHTIMRAKIVVAPDIGTNPGPLCEELMHALTNMPDGKYDAVSCEANQFYPTAFDAHYLRKVYRKYGGHR